ncbi:hypothetical protein GCM10010420_40810 [Streptomyces glaucosporus]|uniref:PAS domain-containing protein n=1 Tax=Streptomyces glaucosporus TaxID=284044 RepID=A0ABP5VP97_9ACTN
MTDTRARILLVEVASETADALEDALGSTADLAAVTAGEVLARTDGEPGGRRPTVVVVGPRLSAPVGLVHAVRPHPADLGVVVMADPATESRLAMLPVLFSAELVRRVPADGAGRLPEEVRELLEEMAGHRAQAAALAAAQRRLAPGAGAGRERGERLLGEFLAQAPIGALMLDEDESVIAWNRRAADVLGLTDPESFHRPLADLFPPDDRAALRRHLAASAGRVPPGPDLVFERVGPDGAGQALRIAPQQVLDLEGRRRILVLAEDVTDRLHAQRKLAERTGHALLSAEVAAAMTAAGPLPERLDRCVGATVDRLGAARVCVWTVSPSGEPEHVSCAGDDEEDGAGVHPDRERELVGRILAEGRPHLDAAPPGDHRAASRASFAGYPLTSGGELMGVLALTTRLALSGAALSVLESIADQMAVGIQQDRLLHRLRAATQALERPLLPPRLPDLPGFDLAARYHPFGNSLHIGGDFYDAFTVPDGRHVLVLGDVCGKGPSAAAITGLVRHTLWAAAQHTPDPGHVLGLVNHALRRQNTPFCTLTYAVLEPSGASVRVRLASAGHPAPLLRRADGATSPLEVHGPLLGVLEDPSHPVTEFDLPPGGTLVLYTDGFTEGAGAKNLREPEDLAAFVSGIPLPPGTGRPADRVVAAMMEDAHAWWGERLRDDLAVLALTWLGPDGPDGPDGPGA